MSFRPLFGQITILSLSFVTFRVSRFHVSYLTHETFKLGLQNTLNMSKTARVYFGVLQRDPAAARLALPPARPPARPPALHAPTHRAPWPCVPPPARPAPCRTRLRPAPNCLALWSLHNLGSSPFPISAPIFFFFFFRFPFFFHFQLLENYKKKKNIYLFCFSYFPE